MSRTMSRTMSRALFRLSTPLAALPVCLPVLCCPTTADAQDRACAVGAPAGDATTGPDADAADKVADLRGLATGAGVKVAVIDTGVARHPQLNQLAGGADFVEPDAPEPLKDCDAHGTAVAGIIAGTDAGIAPDADVLSIRQSSAHYRSASSSQNVKAENEAAPGAGDLETLTRAIHNALDEKAGIINISVVSCVEPELAPRVDTQGIEEALRRAEREGAVVVAAAGNVSHECPAGSTVYPAHFPTVLTVGARADSHTVADYSLPVPDGTTLLTAPGTIQRALAPGVPGWSTGKAGDRGVVEPFTGTSFAAPVVSGTAALLRQRYPNATPAQIRGMITGSAEPRGGAVDPVRAVTYLEQEDSPHPEPLRVVPVQTAASAAPARSGFAVICAVLAAVVVVIAGSLRQTLRSRPKSAAGLGQSGE